MNKITRSFILVVGIFLVGCGDDSSEKKPVSATNNTPTENANNSNTNNSSQKTFDKIKDYENEYGQFEVLYAKDNLGLSETYDDFEINVSSVEYGLFSISEAYDYYPELENKEGKIGYVKVHIAMDLPASVDPGITFYPNLTELTITEDIPPIASDNNFADEVAINLGTVAMEEGYLFYLLAPNAVEKLEEVKSFSLSTFAPFTSNNMFNLIEGYQFKISFD